MWLSSLFLHSTLCLPLTSPSGHSLHCSSLWGNEEGIDSHCDCDYVNPYLAHIALLSPPTDRPTDPVPVHSPSCF